MNPMHMSMMNRQCGGNNTIRGAMNTGVMMANLPAPNRAMAMMMGSMGMSDSPEAAYYLPTVDKTKMPGRWQEREFDFLKCLMRVDQQQKPTPNGKVSIARLERIGTAFHQKFQHRSVKAVVAKAQKL